MSAPQQPAAGNVDGGEERKDGPPAAPAAETNAKPDKGDGDAKDAKGDGDAKAKAADTANVQTQSKETECADCKQRTPAKLSGKFVSSFNRKYTLWQNEQFPGFNNMGLQRFRSFTNKVWVLCVHW